jgi:hypothetical protein
MRIRACIVRTTSMIRDILILEPTMKSRPWCLFNVMMIQLKGSVAYRSAIGRIHVDAFLYANAVEKVVTLE